MNIAMQWLWLGSVVGGGLLVWLLAPVLSPFLLAALFAYLANPLVNCLQARRIPRTLSVVIVFVVLLTALAIAAMILVPLLERQITALVHSLPAYIDWVQTQGLPRVAQWLGVDATQLLDTERLKAALAEHWREAGGMLGGVVHAVTQSGLALAAFFGSLVLVPVVTFYLLCDWPELVAHLQDLIPRRHVDTVAQLTRAADDVLAAFLRGQLLVMLLLGVVYAVGLWLVGLELALLLGMLAGTVSFVPYLGFVVGVLSAGAAALLQFQEWMPVVYVLLVFGVGQVIEGTLLTPWLVGDRIGLHPVAVIFAVLAGGKLFGFAGVLLALPAAAVIMVLLRHVHRRYLDSAAYGRAPGSG